MSSKKASPSEQVLDAVEEIANMKQTLSDTDRSLTSADGLFVQSGSLPGGGIQYMAGGKFLAQLVFERGVDGTRIVRKYKPGDWEVKVEETLLLCRMLYRGDQALREWAPQGFFEHRHEVEAIWADFLRPRRKDLANLFLTELENEWPLEYSEAVWELPPQLDRKDDRVMRVAQEVERVWDGLPPLFLENPLMSLGTLQVQMAYVLGYMVSRGWVSQADVAKANLYLGDQFAATIRRLFNGAKSKGIAFTSALSCVSARGTADACAEPSPQGEER